MAGVLEVEVPQGVFSRRIQPFGVALAEVSWRVKMFTHDGVVLAALQLEEPNLIIALPFWPHPEVARRLFKGKFEISLVSTESSSDRVRMDVQLDAATVEELFLAAELINANPNRVSVRRAEKHFTDFLTTNFPDTLVVWAHDHRWRERRRRIEHAAPIRVG
jgi:endonuclease/exonuclease/phosphatase (EEP) superfamily protein YafD